MEDIEELSLRQSRERFHSVGGEAVANNGLLLADAMVYAIGFICFILEFFKITTGISPSEWRLADGDCLLLSCGLLLWLCSQSLNDFKRLLPLWLRMVLRMSIGPKEFAEQSRGARIRRAYTLAIASALSFIAGWRISVSHSGLTTRVGLEFHLVIYAVALALLLLSLYWFRLIDKDDDYNQLA